MSALELMRRCDRALERAWKAACRQPRRKLEYGCAMARLFIARGAAARLARVR